MAFQWGKGNNFLFLYSVTGNCLDELIKGYYPDVGKRGQLERKEGKGYIDETIIINGDSILKDRY